MTPSAIKLTMPFGIVERMPKRLADTFSSQSTPRPRASDSVAASPRSTNSAGPDAPPEPLVKPGKTW